MSSKTPSPTRFISMLASAAAMYHGDTTHQKWYEMEIKNNCPAQTYVHLSQIHGHLSMEDINAKSNQYKGGPDILSGKMEPGQVGIVKGVLDDVLGKPLNMSTWRLWWDKQADSRGAQVQTLVENTCEDDGKHGLKCFIDASVIDGLTSAVQVEFPTEPDMQSISVKPPRDWECPPDNRMVSYPEIFPSIDKIMYLDAHQTCMSNCSLKVYAPDKLPDVSWEAACCTNSHNTSDTCEDQSPALKEATPEAYVFAYDDSTPYNKDGTFVTPLRADNFEAEERIFKITLCP